MMYPQMKERIVANAAELKRRQEQPQDTSVLPTLTIDDIQKVVESKSLHKWSHHLLTYTLDIWEGWDRRRGAAEDEDYVGTSAHQYHHLFQRHLGCSSSKGAPRLFASLLCSANINGLLTALPMQ